MLLVNSVPHTVQFVFSSPGVVHSGDVVTVYAPAVCPFAGIVVISVLAIHLLQCLDFSPVSVHVGSTSIVNSVSKSCPNAEISLV